MCAVFPRAERPDQRDDHLPLGPRSRNYAEIVVSLEPDTRVTVDLVRVKTNMFEITNYMSEEEED